MHNLLLGCLCSLVTVALSTGTPTQAVRCPVLVNTMQALVDAAAHARTKQLHDVVVQCLREAVERAESTQAPKNTLASLHNELGLAVYGHPSQGPQAAVVHFEQATALLPSFSNAQFNAAACLAAASKHKEAQPWFHRALKLDPTNGNYHFQYALTLLGMEEANATEVESSLETALQFDPQNAMAYNLLGVAKVRQGNHSQGLGLFQKAVELSPESGTLYANLGSTQRELQQDQTAVATLEMALKLEPTKVEHYHNLAGALEAADDFPHELLKRAVELYSRAAKDSPQNPLFHYDLCGAAFKIQDFKVASSACDQGLALAQGYAPLHFRKGQVLQEQGGNDEAALKSFEYAHAIEPTNERYSFSIRGAGGTPRDYSQQAEQPAAPAGQGAPASTSSADVADLKASLTALEKKMTGKLQASIGMIDALNERLERFETETNRKLEKILAKLSQDPQAPKEQAPEGPIEPIYPPGGKAAYEAMMGL